MANIRVRALANLALVKYFGKRDVPLNLPAAGSLSLTLEPLVTTTRSLAESSVLYEDARSYEAQDLLQATLLAQLSQSESISNP